MAHNVTVLPNCAHTFKAVLTYGVNGDERSDHASPNDGVTEAPMLLIHTAMRSVARLVALMAATIAKRPFDVHELGPVSARWIATHRVDVP